MDVLMEKAEVISLGYTKCHEMGLFEISFAEFLAYLTRSSVQSMLV